MGVLQRFERRVETLVNDAFARAFKAEVQPVEIASALQRECDNQAAIVARGRSMVPNAYVVELSPSDHDRLGGYSVALADELAGMVREHAHEQRYSFVGPVAVDFERSDDLDTGVFRVRSTVQAGASTAVPADPRRVGGTSRSPYLEVNGSGFALTERVTVIGRGAEADLRIDDPGISRRHAELRMSGTLVQVVDLGSTNGVVLDGRRVDRAELYDGARLTLGSTHLVYRVGG